MEWSGLNNEELALLQMAAIVTKKLLSVWGRGREKERAHMLRQTHLRDRKKGRGEEPKCSAL